MNLVILLHTMKKEWMTLTFFLAKICLSLFLERVKSSVSVREWQRPWDKRRGHRLAEDCYIELFLTHVIIPYSVPYTLASLTKTSQTWPTVCSCPLLGWHLLPWPVVASVGWPWLSDSVTDSVYLYIYNFLTVVIHGIYFRLSNHASFFPVYTTGTSSPRNPWLTALSKVNMQQVLFFISCVISDFYSESIVSNNGPFHWAIGNLNDGFLFYTFLSKLFIFPKEKKQSWDPGAVENVKRLLALDICSIPSFFPLFLFSPFHTCSLSELLIIKIPGFKD